METKETVQGRWNEFSGAVKKKYSQITGDDLSAAKGNIQQLTSVIQRKTGQAREEIETYLSSISSKSLDSLGAASHLATEYLDKAGTSIHDGCEHAKDATQDSYESEKEPVGTKPVEAIAIAFGLGVALGILGAMSMFRRS